MLAHSFANWLYGTPTSTFLRETEWIIPTVQSIHILSVAIVVGSALVSDLRLAGIVATDEPPAVVVRRYLPWMWSAILVLLITGLIMIVAEPNRTLDNAVFWSKMALLIVAVALTLFFRKPLLDSAFDIERAVWRPAVKPAAWLSLTIWIAVIFCGRWIAYT